MSTESQALAISPGFSFPCSHSPPLEGCKFSRSRIISRPTPSHVSPATSLSVTPSRWPPRSPLLPAPITASLCSLPEHGDSLWGQERLGMGLGPQAHIYERRDARTGICTPCAVWVSGGSSCCMPGFGVLQSWKSGGSLVPLSRDLGFMWPCIVLGSSKIPILWCLLSPPALSIAVWESSSPGLLLFCMSRRSHLTSLSGAFWQEKEKLFPPCTHWVPSAQASQPLFGGPERLIVH